MKDRKWLEELLLESGYTQEVIDSDFEHIDNYGLMSEVLEWTEIYVGQGFEPATAYNYALDEWDL